MSKIIRLIYQTILWLLIAIIFSVFMYIGYHAGLELDNKFMGLAAGFTVGLIFNFFILGISLMIINLDKNLEKIRKTLDDNMAFINFNIEYIKETIENKQREEQIKSNDSGKNKGVIYNQNGIPIIAPDTKANSFA